MPQPHREPVETEKCKETHYQGFVIRKFQPRFGARITFRIYTPCGFLLDAGNRKLKDAFRRIDFLTQKGIWTAMRYELKMLSNHPRPEPGALVEVKSFISGKKVFTQQIEVTQADEIKDRVAFMGTIHSGPSAGKSKGLNIHKDFFKWVA